MKLPVLLSVFALTSSAQEIPSASFNLPGQARTRHCVVLKQPKVPLRFADGTPTGWFIAAEDPSQLAANRRPCAPGSAEMDLHEILTNAAGMRFYFHPGGGGSLYQDPVQNGQYGHIALDDLVDPPTVTGDHNGKPAPLSGANYLIIPTRLPLDMWYKPNVEHGHSGSTYHTYGNPGYSKTGGRGDWTYINWSWVQNGRAKYPDNICRGGGMVRALGKRDSLFEACGVAPIVGYSYGADNQINGRVTAFYGKAFAGPGRAGSEIYGWLPLAYQRNGELIVPCVRRADIKVLEGGPAPKNPMERMAWNLTHPVTPNPMLRQKLVQQLQTETEPLVSMEVLTELSRMDEPETVKALLDVLAWGKQPRVREQAIALIGFMASTPKVMPAVAAAFTRSYASGDEREKLRILDVISNFACSEAAQFATTVWKKAANQTERSAAADAILKLAPRTQVDASALEQAKRLQASRKAKRAE